MEYVESKTGGVIKHFRSREAWIEHCRREAERNFKTARIWWRGRKIVVFNYADVNSSYVKPVIEGAQGFLNEFGLNFKISFGEAIKVERPNRDYGKIPSRKYRDSDQVCVYLIRRHKGYGFWDRFRKPDGQANDLAGTIKIEIAEGAHWMWRGYLRKYLMRHELGHLFGAPHHYDTFVEGYGTKKAADVQNESCLMNVKRSIDHYFCKKCKDCVTAYTQEIEKMLSHRRTA